jgi:hypothetical protein
MPSQPAVASRVVSSGAALRPAARRRVCDPAGLAVSIPSGSSAVAEPAEREHDDHDDQDE